MNINRPLTKFLFSQEMENLEIQKNIMNLGRMLAKELDLDPGVDTLARWMAHYIAEQIILVEKKSGEEKKLVEEQCLDMILKLWSHRARFPNGVRPFENFESIFNTLSRLNPESKESFFFNNKYIKEKEFSKEVQDWLDIANEIDKIARVWIKFALNQAALDASDESTSEWLKKVTLFEEKNDSLLIRLLRDDVYFDEETKNVTSNNKEQIQHNIEILEKFNELNDVILKFYNEKLDNYE
ncbi:hypothetical protein [Solibacillus sp. NPDC093137]|uniref:hypothetical protein n=1 Tax=Solibacillus sp. NPDC093137 TaxID=3390678 RepID=UPI003CFDF695